MPPTSDVNGPSDSVLSPSFREGETDLWYILGYQSQHSAARQQSWGHNRWLLVDAENHARYATQPDRHSSHPWSVDRCTDGSCFIQEGSSYARSVVVIGQKKVVLAQASPRSTSIQLAEIIALTRALRWTEGKKWKHLHRQLIYFCYGSYSWTHR